MQFILSKRHVYALNKPYTAIKKNSNLEKFPKSTNVFYFLKGGCKTTILILCLVMQVLSMTGHTFSEQVNKVYVNAYLQLLWQMNKKKQDAL